MGLTCLPELPTQPETRGIVVGTDTVDPEISLPPPPNTNLSPKFCHEKPWCSPRSRIPKIIPVLMAWH